MTSGYSNLANYAGVWVIDSTDGERSGFSELRVYYSDGRFTIDRTDEDGGCVIWPCAGGYCSASKWSDSTLRIPEDQFFSSLVGVTLCFAFWMPGLLRPAMITGANPASDIVEDWRDDGLLRAVSYTIGKDLRVECRGLWQIAISQS